MRIGIHKRKGSFSENWIKYCEAHQIEYKIVNAYDSDIIQQLKDCDAFMWHHHHAIVSDLLFAKQLCSAIEESGKIVFPDYKTSWFFDDKVAQKYLLEGIHAPIVPSYVFYDKKIAMQWAQKTQYPKVFKLRGGAGSSNVKLVRNYQEAKKIILRAFGHGFRQIRIKELIREQYRKYKMGLITLRNLINYSLGLALNRNSLGRKYHIEKGYAYFQNFIPQNKFDIRICVVNNKAFAIKRMCRENDFRASGSGEILYSRNSIDLRCVKLSLEIAKKLQTQSIGIDYIFDANNKPMIVEISYGFTPSGYIDCEGYWDSDLNWHEGSHFDFCGWMVENIIEQINEKK